jgi:hypothetical protein
MQLYGRIDLHSNSHHLGIIDENQKMIIGDVGAKRNKKRDKTLHGVRKGVNPAPRIETRGFL